MKLKDLATDKFRWLALVVLALSLAIVVIDNSVLNVAVPYIIRDLKTNLSSMEWVISGYALIIATLLITVGRLGDIYGRRKIFMVGLVFFAIGSFIASIAPNVGILFFGEAFVEAIGASMMLTSSLSLIVTEFRGRERAIAFGVWGSVAGAAAALGPLLGGYFTSYYSWRWSLRINVVVAIVAILGCVFVKEAKGEQEKHFDFPGMFLSGAGLFSLVFALIEGKKYGWFGVNEIFKIDSWQWPFTRVSVIPFAFLAAAVLLAGFFLWEYRLEKAGRAPLMRPSIFKNISFSVGLATVVIIGLGQFGIFFVMPIYLQNVLGLDAFHTGLLFLIAAATMFVVGPVTGFIASRISPKWIVTSGMFILAAGALLLRSELSSTATGWTLAPGLFVFGVGMAMASAQLTNIVLSSVPQKLSGEASAINATARQVGTSVGIAIIGMVLAGAITTGVQNNVKNDSKLPLPVKNKVIESAGSTSFEGGQFSQEEQKAPVEIVDAIKSDVENAIVDASKEAIAIATAFIVLGGFISVFTKKPVGEKSQKS